MLHVHYARDDILLLLANSYLTRTTLTLEFATTTVFYMIYDVLVRPMVTSPSRFDSSVVTFGMDSTANYIVMARHFIRAPAPYQRALQRPSSSNTHDGVPRPLRNPGRPIIFHTSGELVMSSPMLCISRESLCSLTPRLFSLLCFSLIASPFRSRGGQSTSVGHGLAYALSSSAAFIPGRWSPAMRRYYHTPA